jgi:hypothetical protein
MVTSLLCLIIASSNPYWSYKILQDWEIYKILSQLFTGLTINILWAWYLPRVQSVPSGYYLVTLSRGDSRDNSRVTTFHHPPLNRSDIWSNHTHLQLHMIDRWSNNAYLQRTDRWSNHTYLKRTYRGSNHLYLLRKDSSNHPHLHRTDQMGDPITIISMGNTDGPITSIFIGKFCDQTPTSPYDIWSNHPVSIGQTGDTITTISIIQTLDLIPSIYIE